MMYQHSIGFVLLCLINFVMGQHNEQHEYLKATPLLDYHNHAIQQLIGQHQWQELNTGDRVKAVYNFVRDDIAFGYNRTDDIPASAVLEDGYGQCNTKATLLMALLRATGVPNRIHGFTIDKELQRGALRGLWYLLSPQQILHSWVEVYINGQWYFLEGVILDKPYLEALQQQNKHCKTTFCGYGVYTSNFEAPPVEWEFNNTYIQHEGIHEDFGIFATPDEFYAQHKQKMGCLKQFIFQKIVRHRMNTNVSDIRNKR